MLQPANTDLFNLIIPKAHNSVSKSTIYSKNNAIKCQLKIIGGFIFFHPSAPLG